MQDMNVTRRSLTVILAMAFISQFSAAQEITVAAAVDLQSDMQEIAAQFQKETQPNRELVERAIAEVLAARHHTADFVRMLDSGMRISDFLTAMDGFTSADRAIDCDCS
jgi:hypothetical protein